MFTHLTLRSKLLAIVVPPLGVLAVVAAYALMLGTSGADSLDELSSDVKNLGIVSVAACLLGLLGVVIVGRTITDPLSELADATDDLARHRLPTLVDALTDPRAETPSFPPLEIDGNNDELGRLVEALNAVQASLTEVAGQQRAVVREGINEVVISLARRNQALVDRQIEIVDQMESKEQEPERLERLFQLDHLATRLRRGAESLLILAGAEPPRRRGAPVPMSDVVRVAMSEIEAYRRISLRSIDNTAVNNQAAADLAHLLSELLENATTFSPPDTQVEVEGVAQGDGTYLLSVKDNGLGLTSDQLESANILLARPAELNLGMSRTLGFQVVARLAGRLGATVELAAVPTGGVQAFVLVPAAVLGDHAAPSAPIEVTTVSHAAENLPELSDTAVSVDPALPARIQKDALAELLDADESAHLDPSQPPADASSDLAHPPPDPDQRAADPIDIAFDLPSVPTAPSIPVSPPPPAATESSPSASAPPQTLAQAMPEGEDFDRGVESLLSPQPQVTDAGLVKRDRSRSQAPTSEGRPAAPSGRSPEEIRQMLSRYRNGRTAGGDDPGPDTSTFDPEDPFYQGEQS